VPAGRRTLLNIDPRAKKRTGLTLQTNAATHDPTNKFLSRNLSNHKPSATLLHTDDGRTKGAATILLVRTYVRT